MLVNEEGEKLGSQVSAGFAVYGGRLQAHGSGFQEDGFKR